MVCEDHQCTPGSFRLVPTTFKTAYFWLRCVCYAPGALCNGLSCPVAWDPSSWHLTPPLASWILNHRISPRGSPTPVHHLLKHLLTFGIEWYLSLPSASVPFLEPIMSPMVSVPLEKSISAHHVSTHLYWWNTCSISGFHSYEQSCNTHSLRNLIGKKGRVHTEEKQRNTS